MPVQVPSILRRALQVGDISGDTVSLAILDLLDLRVELFPFHPFAERVWELHDNFTAYDAWYVALAENLHVELATLDMKLNHAPGLRCSFETPGG